VGCLLVYDTLMQGLTAITLQLDTAGVLVDPDTDAVRVHVRQALPMAQETMTETRAAIQNLERWRCAGRA